MRAKNDWIRAALAATAGFAITAIVLDTSLATADKPVVKQQDVVVPTLNIGAVTVTAQPGKSNDVLDVTDAVAYVKAGTLPSIDLIVSNPTDRNLTVKLYADVLTSRIPNIASRVPMPASGPKSQWTQEVEVAIAPGETKTVPLSTQVKLGWGYFANVQLRAGKEKVDVLRLNTGPAPVRVAAATSGTQPVAYDMINPR